MTDRLQHRWSPIADLPVDRTTLTVPELQTLARLWQEQSDRLRHSDAYNTFLQRMQRELAIETGIIERLYTIDRGITQLLIEQGIDEALIPHESTDRPVANVVAMIRDQQQAVEGLFAFVKQERPLSNSYIKELHQILTAHQERVEAIDSLGRRGWVEIRRGDWKKLPNSPSRADGWLHEYCPPEQVTSEMDRLIDWHASHLRELVSPEVEAAWLHHRFTQIHPFQDGNGRVARCLASLVFLQAGWFPLVITRDDNADYITALEEADLGDLSTLVRFFARRQKRSFLHVLSISESVLRDKAPRRRAILESAAEILRRHKQEQEQRILRVCELADGLHVISIQRFQQAAQEVGAVVQAADPEYRAWQTHARNGSDHDYFYRYQVISCARELGYFANTSVYRAWTAMAIVADQRTEILLSIHGLGREARGILVCSAMAYHKQPLDSDEETRIDQLVPLCQDVFEFTYMEPHEQLHQRFEHWLEEVLTTGLEYWRRGL